jgi:hypothetical protein
MPRQRPVSQSTGATPGLLLFLVLSCLTAPSRAADTLWDSRVEPVLKEYCSECHSASRTKSGLDVGSLQTLLRGGDRGAAVIPGRPDDSNLYRFLAADSDPHMPPGKRRPPSAEDVALIRRWIQELPVIKGPVAGSASSGMGVAGGTNAATVRHRISWHPPAGMDPSAAVDRFLELAWRLDKVRPVKPAPDEVLVRRVYLDLVGRIPTSEEARRFVADRSSSRRGALVTSLLGGADYARHMREVFDPVLMSRRGPEWEARRAEKKWHGFLEDAFGRNRPWNEVVRDLIVARPERPEDQGAVWYLYERQNNAQAMAEALAPVVFGVQMKCAQCHDHMIAREIKQAHYWGLVAALNRTRNVDTPSGPGLSESAIGGFVSFANLKKESQPAVMTFFNGRSVDEPWPKEGEKEVDRPELYRVPPPPEKGKAEHPAVPRFSRREALADAVTRENPLLARAMVNRVWAMLFGRGLVHPVDLMDSKHPPSHPELLDWLASDFARSGHDVKRLIRILCATRAYQLDSRLPSAGAKPPPLDSFARALDKPLSAEQLHRSLLLATGNTPDASGKIGGLSESELRQALIAQFPDLFPAEYNASLQQAMFFSNSPLIDTLLAPRPGTLVSRLAAVADPSQRAREAFLAVYGRAPDPDELRECREYLASRPAESGTRQLVWALVTGAEFQVNH